MAKIKYGAMVAEASGSVGGVVFSHNRYGTYTRRRAIPTKSLSPAALAAKGLLASISQAWAGLTEPVRLQWRTWAATNPVTDALGDSQVLTGHAAFCMLNCRLVGAGSSVISSPPVISAPNGLTGFAGTFDIGTGDFEVTWTNTPLGAGVKVEIWAAVVSEPGISFVENLYKRVMLSTAPGTSPVDSLSAIEARFGTLIVGQQVFIKARAFDTATGLVSGYSVAHGLVINTP